MDLDKINKLVFLDVFRRIFIVGTALINLFVRQEVISSAKLSSQRFPVIFIIVAITMAILPVGNQKNSKKYIITEIIYTALGFIFGLLISFSLIGEMVSLYG